MMEFSFDFPLNVDLISAFKHVYIIGACVFMHNLLHVCKQYLCVSGFTFYIQPNGVIIIIQHILFQESVAINYRFSHTCQATQN